MTYDVEISVLVHYFCSSGCPDNYSSGVYKLQCYRVITQSNNLENQKSMCEADGGYLAELVDHDERNSLHNYTSGKSQHLLYDRTF